MNFHATASDMFELLERGECSRAFAYIASRRVSGLETRVILTSLDLGWSDKRQIIVPRQRLVDKKSQRGIGAIPRDGVVDIRPDRRVGRRRFAEALPRHVAS